MEDRFSSDTYHHNIVSVYIYRPVSGIAVACCIGLDDGLFFLPAIANDFFFFFFFFTEI